MDGGGGRSPHGGVDCDTPLGDEVSLGLAPFLNPAPLYARAAPGPLSLVASRGTNGTASRRDTDPEGQTEPAGNVNGNRWVTGRSAPHGLLENASYEGQTPEGGCQRRERAPKGSQEVRSRAAPCATGQLPRSRLCPRRQPRPHATALLTAARGHPSLRGPRKPGRGKQRRSNEIRDGFLFFLFFSKAAYPRVFTAALFIAAKKLERPQMPKTCLRRSDS